MSSTARGRSGSSAVVDLTGPDAAPPHSAPRPFLNYSQCSHGYVSARFIVECGKKLELDSVVVCTACAIFHSFYKNAGEGNAKEYDQYVSPRPRIGYVLLFQAVSF